MRSFFLSLRRGLRRLAPLRSESARPGAAGPARASGLGRAVALALLPRCALPLPPLALLVAAPSLLAAACPGASADVLINEVDCDQAGVDTLEFIELIAAPGADLSGLFLVLYNGDGPGDPAYEAVDLYGLQAGSDGLFVVGAAGVEQLDLLAFSSNGLQNGPDAVVLWRAPGFSPADWLGLPAASLPQGARRLDALVYGTGDASDLELLAALTPGGLQLDEASAAGPGEVSLQRRPDGGQPFDTGAWLPSAPTPGRRNGPLLSVPIHAIQGAGHRSPFVGSYMKDVEGLVTAVRDGRFHLQTVPGQEDDDERTSEALVAVLGGGATGAMDPPQVGQQLLVSGWVEEHAPGGDEANLSTTRLLLAGPWTVLAAGLPLPPPVRLGAGGRVPPDRIIDDDTRDGSVGLGATLFDPQSDGLDFFESLEGMHVELHEALAVDTTSGFGEVAVVGDGGRLASGLAETGLLVRSAGDDNPERILLDDGLLPVPLVGAGDRMPLLRGVLDYSFGSPKLLLVEPATVLPSTRPDPLPLPLPPGWLSVATLNMKNFSPQTAPEQVAALADTIVRALGAPDLLALQEIQDGSGPADDGTLSAAVTLAMLTGAIHTAGGPHYQAVEIAPEDGHDGGAPGGNIRVALLHRTDRPLHLVAHPGGDATTAVQVVTDAEGRPGLRPSPGRIAPGDPAWAGSRKPIAAEYRWRGRTLFVVNVHLRSKLGDTPLFGDWQPPVSASSALRVAQAAVLADFVDELLRADPGAALLLLGDFNDAEGSPTLQRLLQGGQLVDLIETLPASMRASHVYEGNAQALDHIVLSRALADAPRLFHPLPLHAGRLGAPSDHDPLLLAIDLDAWDATLR